MIGSNNCTNAGIAYFELCSIFSLISAREKSKFITTSELAH
jgi:hypothetical protein